MVKVAVFDFPNSKREEFIAAQPLCEHSVGVGRSLVLTRMGVYGTMLVATYKATPKWRMLSRWKQRIALDALKAQALEILEDDDD